jgi:general secretion pathway protein M
MPQAADRDRWLALALLLGVLAVAYVVLVHPWWTVPLREANTRVQAMQEREVRQRMQLQQAPMVAQRLRQARDPGFLPEASAELATAALVQRLETIVSQASPGNRSCAITNRSPMSEARRDRFARVVVQVRLRCGTPELAAVLHSIESGTPRLFVGNLNVLAQRFFFSPGTGATAAQREGGLDVSFDLYGYLPASAAAPPSEVRRAR